MRVRLAAALAVALAGAVPAPALSQAIQADVLLSLDEARFIAVRSGVRFVKEIELDDDDEVWKVEGRDAAGQQIEIEIDARTGAVIKIDRDD